MNLPSSKALTTDVLFFLTCNIPLGLAARKFCLFLITHSTMRCQFVVILFPRV